MTPRRRMLTVGVAAIAVATAATGAAVASLPRATAPAGLASAPAAIAAADALAAPSRPTARAGDRATGDGRFLAADDCATVARAYATGGPGLPTGATSTATPVADDAVSIDVAAPYGPSLVVLAPAPTGCSYRLVERPNVATDIPGVGSFTGFLPVACFTLIVVPVVYAVLSDGTAVVATLDPEARIWKAGLFRAAPGADAAALLKGEPLAGGPLATDAPVPTDDRPAVSVTSIAGTFAVPGGTATIRLDCTHAPTVSPAG